ILEFLQNNPDKTVKDIRIACYGLAFKPDIDDLRESPALKIVESITHFHNGSVIAIEPNIESMPKGLSGITSVNSLEKVSADIHLLLVDHLQFKNMEKPEGIIIDTRGVWS
ncbi:UDP-N-acetyl-D-mannosamine dehydrogenase, partial [Vibrio parahaemolyticus]